MAMCIRPWTTTVNQEAVVRRIKKRKFELVAKVPRHNSTCKQLLQGAVGGENENIFI